MIQIDYNSPVALKDFLDGKDMAMQKYLTERPTLLPLR